MSGSKGRTIQLAEKELEHAREATARAVEHLEKIARVALARLGHKMPSLGPDGISKIIIMPNNTKMIFYGKDGRCAGVYEDPPGICRSCNDPSSSDGHAE